MNKREIAILAGLASLTGCGMSQADKARRIAIDRQLLGDPSKEIQNFRFGPPPRQVRDLPGQMQKSRIDR